MQFIEIIFLLSSFGMLLVLSFFGSRKNIQKHILLVSLGAFLVHAIFEVVRWQMLFVYLIFIFNTLLYFKKSTSRLFFRVLGFTFALILLGISFIYAAFMPISQLNVPQGPYPVGSYTFALVDKERNEFHTSDLNDKRQLLIDLWYPAVMNRDATARTLWSGLYSGESDIIHFFTRYLEEIPTHSYTNLSPAEGSFPLILFNHGLQMFTSQNTLLMEHLASHGYIVASIGHPYESIRVDLGDGQVILPEFVRSLENFKEGMNWIASSSKPVMEAQKRMETTKDRRAKSEIMLKYLEKANEINEIVTVWTRDTQHVLNWLLDHPSDLENVIPRIDTSKIGIMGMSIGGATAGELCKVDDRLIAGINIDGLQYGKRQRDSLNVPFMMVASDDTFGLNDFMFLRSNKEYYDYHLKGTKHVDLTDLPTVWPILKIYGQTGELPAAQVVDTMNTIILTFWDRHLKEQKEGFKL
ncbi:MAG: alpha/beta hydrolase family protein [Flavobacteriaceae bacterium]